MSFPSLYRAEVAVMALVANLVACTGEPELVEDAGPDTDADTDADTDTDTDSDSDTDSDTVPWSTPEVAGVLLSVWGSGPEDVYAGGAGQTLLHGSGFTWELLPLPEGAVASDIHGSAWNSIYVAAGPSYGGEYRMLRYDGAVWSDVEPAVNDTNYPVSIWVFGIDDVFIITTWVLPMLPGVYGTSVAHFDGTAWSGVWSDEFASGYDGQRNFEDMAGTEDGQLFAVGVSHISHEGEPSAVVSDGVAWWKEDVPEPDLHGVWALDAENVWAVGDGGAVLERGDAAWEHEDAPTSARLDGIFGWSADEQIAVGDGVILNKNGAAWELQDVPADGALLHGVWGASPTDVYAVGELDGGALILHYDGVAWLIVYGG